MNFQNCKTMDIKAQVTKWVEKKLGGIIYEDLKEKISNEHSAFDVQTYINNLEKKYFTKTEVEILKKKLNSDFGSVTSEFYSFDSDEENSSKDSVESYDHEFQTFSVDEIVKNLESHSKITRMQSLQALEGCTEELINHPSWIVVQKILLKILKQKGDTKMHNLVLKVFLKFLTCTSKPQIVCEAFTTVSKILTLLITLKDDSVSYEEVYDLKGNKWFHKEKVSADAQNDNFKTQKPADAGVLVKLMWMLIHCQQQMPGKWIRFKEKRLRQIIFTFVHLLSFTNSEKNRHLTALQLLSILNPTASWCRSWCHTAVGRNLLCSALRKYKTFFIHMVEIILNKIKTSRVRQLQSLRNNEIISKSQLNRKNGLSGLSERRDESHTKERDKCVRSAPVDSSNRDDYYIHWRIKEGSKWLTEGISKVVVTEAMFWHSTSVVMYLIQFRCGQALFPVQTATRKRSLSVKDLSLTLTDYFESLKYNEQGNKKLEFGIPYQAEVQKKIELLKKVRSNLLSSRMKTEGSPLSQKYSSQ